MHCRTVSWRSSSVCDPKITASAPLFCFVVFFRLSFFSSICFDFYENCQFAKRNKKEKLSILEAKESERDGQRRTETDRHRETERASEREREQARDRDVEQRV